MNVVLLHYASPPVVGGVESVLARQAELFVAAGHSVKVLTGRGSPWDAHVVVKVIPEFDSRHPVVLRVKQSLDQGVIPPDFEELVDHLSSSLSFHLQEADILIVHNVASLHKNLALTAALRRFVEAPRRTRVILWHHDFAWNSERYQNELHPGYPWDLLRTPWPGARQVTISRARQEEMSRLFGLPLEEIRVVSNGVDFEGFLALQPETRALVEQLNLVQANPLLLAPVRLTRRKNLEFGLRIMAELKKILPAARWVVTGPLGAHNPENLSYFNALCDLRAELGLQSSVHFLAETYPDGLSDAQIGDIYRLADALLLPSQEEGFGLPLIEAALARLVIFASDLPPLRALGGDWAEYFDLGEEPQRVARRIAARLTSDPVHCLRANIRANYTWEAVYRNQIAPLLQP